MFINRILNIRNKNAFINPINAFQIAPSLMENITRKIIVWNPTPHFSFKRDDYIFPSKNNTENNNPEDKIPYHLVVTVVLVVSGYAFYYFFKKK